MRRLLLFIVLLYAPASWAQTITLVQHTSGDSGSSSVSSQTAVFSSNPALNNLLVAGTGSHSAGPVTNCSDTLGNTWTLVQTVANGTSSSTGICWAIQKKTPAADTVTCNSSTAGSHMFCGIAEYSVTTSWPATPSDAGNTGKGTATAVTTANFTTTGKDVIFAVMENHAPALTATAGSGYTLLNGTGNRGADEDQLNAASGTYAGTFTDSATDTGWSVSAEAFKPTAPAGGCTPTLTLVQVGRCG